MKTVVMLAFLTAALSLGAEPPPAPKGELESELTARLGATISHAVQGAKPNEIVRGQVTYSGIAVQVLKTDNALQLINPLAPPKYGSPEDNVMRDTPKGRVLGLKIFSIGF